MNSLTQLEDFVERLVESTTFRLMKERLHPVEIAKRLFRAMEQGQVIGPGGRLVPNSYQVELHPKDLELFAACREGLERELAFYLQQTAVQQGLHLMAPPNVSLVANPSVSEHELRVCTTFTEREAVSPVSGEAPSSQTSRLPVEAIRKACLPKAYLVGSSSQPIEIRHGPFRIGRALDSDLVVDDVRISRHHAQITRQGERWLLSDLDSTNGTQVNGVPIRRTTLHSGDLLSLGGAQFTFYLHET